MDSSFDEPRRHRGYLLALLACLTVSVPILFVGRPVRLFAGLPVWLWVSLAATFAQSGLTAWGIARYWKDGPVE